jgi:endonuclease-3
VKISKQEKANKILKILENYYPQTPVPLKHSSPYTLLIAVLLSAQCTDERVNKITPILFKTANTPIKMAKLKVADIEKIIRPCGLSPQKSKAISKLSKILVSDFNSRVPRDLEALEELPGVGHKTASVLVSQAYGIPAFPVDTHIHRLAWRWGLSTGKNVKKTEEDLKKLFPIEKWNKLHLQIIFYGREFCPARGHNLENCIICTKFRRKTNFK